ncbi:hypothetical protein ANO11243_050400 [Dothideomycetidae sp. 11243]|nr:hypothetical protein ANO11243_050400 [fungal sp. No.11243]
MSCIRCPRRRYSAYAICGHGCRLLLGIRLPNRQSYNYQGQSSRGAGKSNEEQADTQRTAHLVMYLLNSALLAALLLVSQTTSSPLDTSSLSLSQRANNDASKTSPKPDQATTIRYLQPHLDERYETTPGQSYPFSVERAKRLWELSGPKHLLHDAALGRDYDVVRPAEEKEKGEFKLIEVLSRYESRNLNTVGEDTLKMKRFVEGLVPETKRGRSTSALPTDAAPKPPPGRGLLIVEVPIKSQPNRPGEAMAIMKPPTRAADIIKGLSAPGLGITEEHFEIASTVSKEHPGDLGIVIIREKQPQLQDFVAESRATMIRNAVLKKFPDLSPYSMEDAVREEKEGKPK